MGVGGVCNSASMHQYNDVHTHTHTRVRAAHSNARGDWNNGDD